MADERFTDNPGDVLRGAGSIRFGEGVSAVPANDIVLMRPGCESSGGQAMSAAAEGFDATGVTTEIYYSQLNIYARTGPITGIVVANGSVASDDWHYAILDANGDRVAGTATGSVTSSGTDAYQKVPFTTALAVLPGPATYYLAARVDGTVDRYLAHGEGTAELGFASNFVCGKITSQGSFAAIPATNSLTLTFTTDLGRIWGFYAA